MFNLEEFKEYLILEPIVDKLNKFLSKSKTTKIAKLTNELENLLDQEKLTVPITYIFSVLAEYDNELISEELIKKIEAFLNSDDIKLRTNSIIIIGFSMIANSNKAEKYFESFAQFLYDKSKDIRDNAHYFIQELVKGDPSLIESIKDILLESILIETNEPNIIALLKFLEDCENLNFEQLYKFRTVSKSLIHLYRKKKSQEIFIKLLSLIKKFFSTLKDHNLENYDLKDLSNLLDNQFIMKKHTYTEFSKKSHLRLREYLDRFKKSQLRDKKIIFYLKTKENIIYVYELEKDKLIELFEEELRISQKKIRDSFSQIINNDSELKIFIKTLDNLKIIKGYYSDLGYFYSYNHIRSNLLNELFLNGIIDLKKYDFLPLNFIIKIIQIITKSTNQKLLLGKTKNIYYSLKKIQEEIDSNAAKEIIIDLKSYREKLLDEEFIKLIKSLPKEYLSSFHKGTQWLTNLGTLRIKQEIQNSKILGYFNISKISKKLNIKEILLIDVFENTVDNRSGIWDKKKEVFYYSKYLKERVNVINMISDEREKLKQIKTLAIELNIDKDHIATKIDENLHLIAEEIKQKDKIIISEYLEKTGMEINVFLKFIDSLGVTYFKKADLLIFNPLKIEEAKNDIKYMLIDKSKSVDNISLGTFDIAFSIIKDLISDLLLDGKVKGIFHENEGEILFYTERGIRNLILENSFLFSFNDLFYGKELKQDEIDLLKEILYDLVKKRKLKGNFDQETLTFSSDEVLFAKDYNTVLFEFEKKVNNYVKIFESEFQRIKEILTKKRETIYPQEIKTMQVIIDKINKRNFGWRSGLEAFINRANKKLLNDQGYSMKKYKDLFLKEKRDDIKLFEEDPEVYELLNRFNNWAKIFNKLGLKYPNAIFYQKRLINNPEDEDSRNKLNELLKELYLT